MSEYVFDGEVVRLNARDFYKWMDMYPSLDLVAELEQIDEEFSIRQREGEKMKKWFSECYARLNGRNKIATRVETDERRKCQERMGRKVAQVSYLPQQSVPDREWAPKQLTIKKDWFE